MNKASSLLSCEEQVKKTGQLPGAGYEAGAGRPPQKAVPGPWLCEGAAIAIPVRVRGCRHPELGATAGPWGRACEQAVTSARQAHSRDL